MLDLFAIALATYNANGSLVEPNETKKSLLPPSDEVWPWHLTAATLAEAAEQNIPFRLADAFMTAAEAAGYRSRITSSAVTTNSLYVSLKIDAPDADGDMVDLVEIPLRFADHANSRGGDYINVAPGEVTIEDMIAALDTITAGYDAEDGAAFATITVAGTVYRY